MHRQAATAKRMPGEPPHEIVPQKRRPPPCNRASADNRAPRRRQPPTARQQDKGAEWGGRVHMLHIMRYIRYRHPVLFARDAGPHAQGRSTCDVRQTGPTRGSGKILSRKKAFLFGRFKILIYFCTTSVKKCCCSSVVEHFLGKEEVTSSSLVNSSKNQEVASIAASFFVPFCEGKGAGKGLPRANVVPIVVP